jgi:hypothetical protein
MDFVRTSTRLLGIGSLAFGVWGLIDPRSLTSLMGDDPRLGRPLAARDAAIGVALLTWPDRPLPLVARMAADSSDTMRLARRSPLVATGAAAFVAWSALTVVAQWAHRAQRSRTENR